MVSDEAALASSSDVIPHICYGGANGYGGIVFFCLMLPYPSKVSLLSFLPEDFDSCRKLPPPG